MAMPVRLKGLYPPSKVYVLSWFPQSTIAKRRAYHIVCDQHQMSSIDVDRIGSKDPADLLKDRGSRRLYTVRLEDSTDVIRLEAIDVNDRL